MNQKQASLNKGYLLDAHHCFVFQSILTLLIFMGLRGQVSFPVQVLLSWNVFALSGIVFGWITLTTKDPYEIKQRIRLKETTHTFLFGIVIFAAIASFLATWLLLTSTKNSPTRHLDGTMILAILTPVLSWFLVHTRFALQYAHTYYAGALESTRENVSGGLIFPEKGHPDYLDFAYFSLVIGMTCQVSDVQISKKNLRRLAMLHGLISFAFNTAIIALIVNIVAGIF